MDISSDNPRRLALFLPDLGGGGAERVALALIDGFIERGFEIDLVLAHQTGQLVPLVPAGVTLFDLGSPRLRSSVGGMVRYLKERQPRALHAMMWPTPLVALAAAAIARVGTRIIASEHVTLSKTPMALKHRAVRSLTRLAYLRADRLIAVSNGTAADLSAFVGISRSAITVIHNPLTLPTVLPDASLKAARWRPGTERLLAVGELKAEKNFSLLIRAMALLRDRRNVSLLILGEGSLEAELKRQVAAAGLKDHVIFAGFDHDVWPYYVAADLFVLSSDVEGFGNVLVEAMHAGTTIVSTDCPSGPSEILGEGRFGALVPCDDERAMADAIAQALSDKSEPETLRARALDLSGPGSIDQHLAVMLDQSPAVKSGPE